MNQSLPVSPAESSKTPRHWPAQLDLCFAPAGGRTRLLRCSHRGPLRVQRLFHPEPSGKAHCYLLHPPGGVVLGDALSIAVEQRGGAVLLTTPSAGRFYDVAGHREAQRQAVQITVRDGLLEWLPQETILFAGARAVLDTRVDLAPGTRLAFWDVLVLGRPACGERFDRGSVCQRLSVRRDGRLLLAERLALAAGDPVCHAPAGLRGASTVGIAVFSAAPPEALLWDWLTAWNGPDGCGDFCVTQRDELLVARYLGDEAQTGRAGFAALWAGLSAHRDGALPATPRIWHT